LTSPIVKAHEKLEPLTPTTGLITRPMASSHPQLNSWKKQQYNGNAEYCAQLQEKLLFYVTKNKIIANTTQCWLR